MVRVRDPPRHIGRTCRIITLESIAKKYDSPSFLTLESTSLARSVISDVPWKLSLKSRLLRVLYNAYGDSLDTTFGQVNLRFLECTLSRENVENVNSYKIPSSLSLLWNPQTLTIMGNRNSKVAAPIEICEIQQLRHLVFFRVYLSEPPPSDEEDRVVLRNLHTLGEALSFIFSEEACHRMPNIKKLCIFLGDNMSYNSLYNIGLLNELESLKLDTQEVPIRNYFLQNFNLPSSLKKLVLQHCKLYWDNLTLIGSLPHLEVLKLYWGSILGPEWNPIEGDFLRLKHLRIRECSHLIHWNADSCHFPILEKLELEDLDKLEEIPWGIGEIATLRDISLDDCSISSVISAIKILEEQESSGNQDLHVRFKFWDEVKREKVREWLELEGFSCHNFQLF